MALKSENLNRRLFLALSCGVVADMAFGGDLRHLDSRGDSQDSQDSPLRGDSQDLQDSRDSHPKSRNLFIYYTRTLNTHILVSYAQSLIGGDLARIDTIDSYPQDYQQSVALSSKQMADGILPPLRPYVLDFQRYDNIFIAAPLWNMDLCAPMKSFLHSANLGDKAIYLILTNAGYGLGESVNSAKSYANIGAILDYEFKDYEKIVPNLLSINMAEIAQNKAFDKLDKEKIAHFLKAFL